MKKYILLLVVNQRFWNILVTWDTIRQFWMLLLKSWLDCEMSSLTDILRVQLKRFTSVVWSTVSEFTILDLPDPAWSSCNTYEISSTSWLLYCDQLRLHLSCNKNFWLLTRRYDSELAKYKFSSLTRLHRHQWGFLNHTQSEPMYNMSVHPQPQYYQS